VQQYVKNKDFILSVYIFKYLVIWYVKTKKNRAEFCPTTAFICADMNENWIRINLNHNHNPPVVDIPMVHLRRSIGMAGISSGRIRECQTR